MGFLYRGEFGAEVRCCCDHVFSFVCVVVVSHISIIVYGVTSLVTTGENYSQPHRAQSLALASQYRLRFASKLGTRYTVQSSSHTTSTLPKRAMY